MTVAVQAVLTASGLFMAARPSMQHFALIVHECASRPGSASICSHCYPPPQYHSCQHRAPSGKGKVHQLSASAAEAAAALQAQPRPLSSYTRLGHRALLLTTRDLTSERHVQAGSCSAHFQSATARECTGSCPGSSPALAAQSHCDIKSGRCAASAWHLHGLLPAQNRQPVPCQ